MHKAPYPPLQRIKTHDHTVYGTGRASPHSFFRHHLAAISSAIKRADALALRNKAAFYEFELLCGVDGAEPLGLAPQLQLRCFWDWVHWSFLN